MWWAPQMEDPLLSEGHRASRDSQMSLETHKDYGSPTSNAMIPVLVAALGFSQALTQRFQRYVFSIVSSLTSWISQAPPLIRHTSLLSFSIQYCFFVPIALSQHIGLVVKYLTGTIFACSWYCIFLLLFVGIFITLLVNLIVSLLCVIIHTRSSTE